MTFNSTKSYVHHICVTSIHESQISPRFALRQLIFSLATFRKRVKKRYFVQNMFVSISRSTCLSVFINASSRIHCRNQIHVNKLFVSCFTRSGLSGRLSNIGWLTDIRQTTSRRMRNPLQISLSSQSHLTANCTKHSPAWICMSQCRSINRFGQLMAAWFAGYSEKMLNYYQKSKWWTWKQKRHIFFYYMKKVKTALTSLPSIDFLLPI